MHFKPCFSQRDATVRERVLLFVIPANAGIQKRLQPLEILFSGWHGFASSLSRVLVCMVRLDAPSLYYG